MRRQMGTLSCSTIPSHRGFKRVELKLLAVGVFQEANSARPFPEDTHPLHGGTGVVWKAQGVKKSLWRHSLSTDY